MACVPGRLSVGVWQLAAQVWMALALALTQQQVALVLALAQQQAAVAPAIVAQDAAPPSALAQVLR